jgi:tripartite-type tricarboxylate transporter receptor subunit TctC
VASNWFGISGPSGMPTPVADRLNTALIAALNTPDLANRLRDLGAEPNKMTRAEFSTLVASDVARWAAVAKSADVRVD